MDRKRVEQMSKEYIVIPKAILGLLTLVEKDAYDCLLSDIEIYLNSRDSDLVDDRIGEHGDNCEEGAWLVIKHYLDSFQESIKTPLEFKD